MLVWLRSLFASPNIICVRDLLDDGKEDSAYPTEFAAMMGRIRQEKPDSLDVALTDIQVTGSACPVHGLPSIDW